MKYQDSQVKSQLICCNMGGLDDEEIFPLIVAKFPAQHLTRDFLFFIKML